ncbi:MAG: hypothetical protein ABSG33_07450 [Candidatus Bathyarchaeia archaeon]|jgi:hypothetical protein
MSENFDLEDFNMIDMEAKKVLEALAEFDKGELVKGELIHKKTGLLPDEINEAVRSLAKSLLVNIPDALKNLAPYKFYAVEITDFGRQVLEQFGTT